MDFLIGLTQVYSFCSYVVQSLCAWVKQHFPSAAEEARALLRTGEQLPPPGDATMYVARSLTFTQPLS